MLPLLPCAAFGRSGLRPDIFYEPEFPNASQKTALPPEPTSGSTARDQRDMFVQADPGLWPKGGQSLARLVFEGGFLCAQQGFGGAGTRIGMPKQTLVSPAVSLKD